jgi:hypothetical protein
LHDVLEVSHIFLKHRYRAWKACRPCGNTRLIPNC